MENLVILFGVILGTTLLFIGLRTSWATSELASTVIAFVVMPPIIYAPYFIWTIFNRFSTLPHLDDFLVRLYWVLLLCSGALFSVITWQAEAKKSVPNCFVAIARSLNNIVLLAIALAIGMALPLMGEALRAAPMGR